MQMVLARDGARAVVRLAGRLDGEWAEHLSATLDDFLREGIRSVVLDMQDVTYLSSPGTQVLAGRYENFAELRGELRITNPSPAALDAIRASGLEDRLLYEEPADIPVSARTRSSAMMSRVSDSHTRADWMVPRTATKHGHYEFTTRDAEARRSCRLVGSPHAFFSGNCRPEDCHPFEFPEGTIALGLGALGTTPNDCLPRFGEFFAAGGVAAYLPTDGALVSDYQVGTREHPPRGLLVHGLVCTGSSSHLGRFRTQPDRDRVPLSELAEVVLETAGTEAVGVVIAAETASLVGTALKQPAGLPGRPSFNYAPSLEEILAFSPEPGFARMTTVVTGVVARAPVPPLAEFLRPLGGTQGLHGHFHAVVFPHYPLPQRTVGFQSLVLRMFGSLKVRTILHLLADDRGAQGAGESSFLRGLCWLSPITSIIGPDA
jgi:stage II sporulation protein AA (anti-sigma F factor antagonist)